ncbi:MAG: hypothetical protein V4635_13920 [Bacteroidota bacterium]
MEHMVTEHNHTELKMGDTILFLREFVRPFFTPAIYNWEFEHFQPDVVFKLLKSGDKIIATQAMLPVTLRIQNLAVSTAKSETSFLSKDFRGKSHFEDVYFSAIDASKTKGCKIIWGFTPAVKVWKAKLKFDVVSANISEATIQLSKYPSASYVRSLPGNKVLNISKQVAFTLAKMVEKKTRFENVKGLNFEVVTQVPAMDVIGNFQKKIASAYNISAYLDLNKDYFDWRINNNPVLKYNKLFFYSGSELMGFVIFSIKNDRLSVADLSALNKDGARYMLNFVISKYGKGIRSVYYFGNDDCLYNTGIFELFSAYGGKVIKSDWANTVIKDVTDTKEFANEMDCSRWLINGLWTEGFSI